MQAMNLISEALRADEQALGKGGVAHVALHVRAVVCLAELERNKGAYSVAVPLLKEAADLCREHLLEDDPIMGKKHRTLFCCAVRAREETSQQLFYILCLFFTRSLRGFVFGTKILRFILFIY